LSKINNHPLVQFEAISAYNKAAKTTSKDYPSLELVRLEKLFFNSKPGKILEFGFGGGCNTFHLLKKKHIVTGIDIAHEAVKKMKSIISKKNYKKNLKVFLLNEKRKKLPFKSETFDYVVAMSVLSLLGSEKKVKNVLKELKRVLKKNGKIIVDINDHNSEFSNKRIQIKKNIFVSNILEKNVKTFCLKSPKDFNKLISKFFKIIDVGYSAHRVFNRQIKEFIICAQKK
tara:strand:- start:1685 stop:2371 length:687 start_codon:yes stop_codon:yes gene_type:complete